MELADGMLRKSVVLYVKAAVCCFATDVVVTAGFLLQMWNRPMQRFAWHARGMVIFSIGTATEKDVRNARTEESFVASVTAMVPSLPPSRDLSSNVVMIAVQKEFSHAPNVMAWDSVPSHRMVS